MKNNVTSKGAVEQIDHAVTGLYCRHLMCDVFKHAQFDTAENNISQHISSLSASHILENNVFRQFW